MNLLFNQCKDFFDQSRTDSHGSESHLCQYESEDSSYCRNIIVFFEPFETLSISLHPASCRLLSSSSCRLGRSVTFKYFFQKAALSINVYIILRSNSSKTTSFPKKDSSEVIGRSLNSIFYQVSSSTIKYSLKIIGRLFLASRSETSSISLHTVSCDEFLDQSRVENSSINWLRTSCMSTLYKISLFVKNPTSSILLQTFDQLTMRPLHCIKVSSEIIGRSFPSSRLLYHYL